MYERIIILRYIMKKFYIKPIIKRDKSIPNTAISSGVLICYICGGSTMNENGIPQYVNDSGVQIEKICDSNLYEYEEVNCFPRYK